MVVNLKKDSLIIAKKKFNSRLIVGTGKYKTMAECAKTIKLSGANPSAPAESVTKALRKAGVSFSVEKIERIKSENMIKECPSVSATKDL